MKITLELEEDTVRALDAMADSLGFTRELAAVYAIRLVNACVREGLLTDIPSRAWPKEAGERPEMPDEAQGMGRVIDFPGKE